MASPENDQTHSEVAGLNYAYLPLSYLNLSMQVSNRLLLYNHKLTIGDIIRGEVVLESVTGLKLSAIKEIETKIEVFLSKHKVMANNKTANQEYHIKLPDFVWQMPLGLLHLDAKTHKVLVDCGIGTIGALYDIKSSSLRNISGIHIQVLTNINTALVMLLNFIQENETVDWFNYYFSRNISILPLNSSRAISVKVLLENLPKILEEAFSLDNDMRGWKVIQRRFGLGGDKLTLADIGNVYGITHERVRQIEAKALKNLQAIFLEQNYAGKSYHMHLELHNFLLNIQNMIDGKYYKLISETDLLEYVKSTFAIETEKQCTFLLFLLSLLKMEKLEFSYPQSDVFWGYCTPIQYKQIDQALKRIDVFLTEETPLPHIDFDILVHINRGVKKSDQVKMEHLPSLVELCNSIERRHDGSIWGKFAYLKGRANQVERLLVESGYPMSIPNLTREINHRLSSQKNYHHISEGSLLNQTYSDKRFVPIGRSGKWSLATWENIDSKTILDQMKEYLIKKNRAVTVDELYDYVSERRPVKKQSIKTYLAMEQKLFLRLGKDSWGLVGWDYESDTETWTREYVADFVANYFKQHKIREVNYQLIKQALMDAANINAYQANGLLNHCLALKRRRIGSTGERKVIFQTNYKELLASEKKHKKQRGSLRQQLGQSAVRILESVPNQQMPQAELMRQLAKMHNCPESTVYAAIHQMEFIERITEDNHRNTCRLRESPNVLESGNIKHRISLVVKRILDNTSSKEMPLIELTLLVQKELSCSRVTAYNYISRLDFIDYQQIPQVRGKLCCLKESAPMPITQMFAQVRGIKNPILKGDIERALLLLNEDFIDLGLFSLGKQFELTMKRYLVTAYAKGKISGKNPDKLALVEMINCIKANGIITDDATLNYLRQSRNDRAHGNIPNENERKLLMKNVQWSAGLYLDYIKFFDDLYGNL